MLAKVLNDFLTPIRKNCCRSSSCVSACLCCASVNRHSVLSCRRLPIRPTIALHSCAWQKPSQHSLLACAALPKRLVSSNARESCDSWLKTFCSAKIPSPFVTAFRFLRVRPKTEDQNPQTVKITFCVRGVATPPCGVPRSRFSKLPSSSCIGAFSQRSMYSTAHFSLACFFTARIISSWSRLSKEATTHYPSSAPSGASDRHPCSPSVRR